MKPSSIRYYFKESFSGLLKNRLMTVASMATVAACILIMSFSYCMVNNLQYMLAQLEDDIGIATFMPSNATAEQVESVKKEIESIEHVTEVEYVSPDAALEDLKKELDADDILAGLEGENNPLSNSFNVSIDDINNQEAVLQKLNEIKQRGDLENIKDAHSETEVLIKINTIISITFVIGSALAAIGSILYFTDRMSVTPFSGTLPGLKCFVAAVFGGIGSILGAVVGGFVIGVVETLLVAMGYSTFSDAFTFLLLIVMLLFRPTGLFGEKSTDKV